jgi:hypothetical protein
MIEREMTQGPSFHPVQNHRIPLWLKVAYTIFVAVMVPTYLREYGPTNFLYFCDVALFLTVAALWLENAFLTSMAAVGILLPQIVWVLDVVAHLVGLKITGMSDYMWDEKIPPFTRAISLFHGWLPFLLFYLVKRLGYDARAFRTWVVLAWVLMLVCFFWMPKPGSVPEGSKQPVNIDYVYGFSSKEPQHWMGEYTWLLLMMIGLPALIWWPTHRILLRVCPKPSHRSGTSPGKLRV